MVTLDHLFALPELAPIQPVGGKDGMNRCISGVNVMESDRLFAFVKESELLVTTGINMDHDELKLMTMVRKACERRASGVILNVGPYIPCIPEQIRVFADTHRFPVFDMPWAYRVADFVKITIQFLATAEQETARTASILSELLFHSAPNFQSVYHELNRLNAKSDQLFQILICSSGTAKSVPASLTYKIEHILSKKYGLLMSMRNETQIIYLVSPIRGTELPLADLLQELKTSCAARQYGFQPAVGAGSACPIMEVKKSYQEALTVLRLAQKHPHWRLCEYNEIGAYGMIINVREPQLIEDFYQKYLGVLYRYDQLNETDFVSFLRVFLEEDGRTANIARKKFIHRNTVLYKIKKIESILDADLNHPFVKTNLQLAFMIEDLMR